MVRSIACVGICVAVAAAVSGCGGSGSTGRPTTVPVSGTVLFEGRPVDGAQVTLVPQTPEGRAAFARTDAQGRFQLMTFTSGDGAIPGSYRVTISKEVIEGGMSPEQAQEHFQKTGQPPPDPKVTNQLPEKYKKPETSGLTATVSESGPNELKFELTP